eukprot:c32047_g1_i1 orf=12-176(-)
MGKGKYASTNCTLQSQVTTKLVCFVFLSTAMENGNGQNESMLRQLYGTIKYNLY